jgi:hypothetical protein
MAYVDVKNQFLGLLNRRDITPSLTDTFMGFGIQRIQRELRIPSMEKLIAVSTDGTANFQMPGDLLEIISLHTNDTTMHKKLVRTDLQTILDFAQIPGIPRYYYREGSTISIGPYPPENTLVYFHYYVNADVLSADTDTNWVTEIAPTLLIYAALSYSCDYYLDDRKQLFEASYQQIADQIQQMALQDELQNASISAAYESSPNYIGPFYGW